MRRGDEARGRMTGKKVVVGDRKKTGMVRHWFELVSIETRPQNDWQTALGRAQCGLCHLREGIDFGLRIIFFQIGIAGGGFLKQCVTHGRRKLLGQRGFTRTNVAFNDDDGFCHGVHC